MKYKCVITYCETCHQITKWRKQCPNGVWMCIKCIKEGNICCS